MNKTEGLVLNASLSAAAAALTCYLDIIAVPLIVLCAVMVLDYASGMASAWHCRKLSSKKGVYGIIKKTGYLALVCVGMGVDWLIYSGLKQVGIEWNYTIFFGVLVTVWLIINELISILENLERIGVPLPNFLTALIRRLKVTAESIAEDRSEDSIIAADSKSGSTECDNPTAGTEDEKRKEGNNEQEDISEPV